MFEVEAGADEKQQIKFVWPNGQMLFCLELEILFYLEWNNGSSLMEKNS